MQLIPYLMFNGQCQAAFKFYEQALGGKIEAMLNHGDSPMAQQVSPDWRSKIMHARISVGGTVLMGMDAPPDRYQEPKGFFVSIGVQNQAEAERVFRELAESGKVQMPLQQTFWALRFGMVVDRFGIPWMVNCEQAGTAASGND